MYYKILNAENIFHVYLNDLVYLKHLIIKIFGCTLFYSTVTVTVQKVLGNIRITTGFRGLGMYVHAEQDSEIKCFFKHFLKYSGAAWSSRLTIARRSHRTPCRLWHRCGEEPQIQQRSLCAAGGRWCWTLDALPPSRPQTRTGEACVWPRVNNRPSVLLLLTSCQTTRRLLTCETWQ